MPTKNFRTPTLGSKWSDSLPPIKKFWCVYTDLTFNFEHWCNQPQCCKEQTHTHTYYCLYLARNLDSVRVCMVEQVCVCQVVQYTILNFDLNRQALYPWKNGTTHVSPYLRKLLNPLVWISLNKITSVSCLSHQDLPILWLCLAHLGRRR